MSVSRRSLVRVEGAVYSAPSTWAGLDVSAYVGVDMVTLAEPKVFGGDEKLTTALLDRLAEAATNHHHPRQELPNQEAPRPGRLRSSPSSALTCARLRAGVDHFRSGEVDHFQSGGSSPPAPVFELKVASGTEMKVAELSVFRVAGR